MSKTAEVVMNLRAIIVIVCSVIGAGGSQRIYSNDTVDGDRHSIGVERLVGAWRLVSLETVRANNEVIYPFYGKHPEGLLIYDRSGWMSVQIVSDPKPMLPTNNTRESFLASPASEKVSAIDGCYAYFGTWSVDSAGMNVTHHIDQSLYPGERGENGTRQFSIDGNHLTLKAKAHEMGEDHQRKLVWERLSSAQH